MEDDFQFRKPLFWDVEPSQIDTEKHATFIIERIMDLGNDAEVKWMWKKYPRMLLASVASRSRRIRPETRTFWQLMTSE